MPNISVGQALLILMDEAKENNNSEELTTLKRLYFSGIKDLNDDAALQDLLQNPKLSKYKILHDPNTIDEDPTRRFFETRLAFYTTLEVLRTIDSEDIKKYRLLLYEKLGDNEKTNFDAILNGQEKMSRGTSHYYDIIEKLSSDYYLKIFSAKDKEILKEITLATLYSVTIAKQYNDSLPINIFRDGFFKDRARITKQFQDKVRARNFGLLKSYMPLMRDDIDTIDASKAGFPFLRPVDKLSPDLKADWANENFRHLVHPYISGISGTLLAHFRVIAHLISLENNVFSSHKKMKDFLKLFICSQMHLLGGHSFFEFDMVVSQPKVRDFFSNHINEFKEINMNTIFLEENQDAFNRSLDDAISYNRIIVNRASVLAEIKEKAFDQKTERKLSPSIEALELKLEIKNKKFLEEHYPRKKKKPRHHLAEIQEEPTTGSEVRIDKSLKLDKLFAELKNDFDRVMRGLPAPNNLYELMHNFEGDRRQILFARKLEEAYSLIDRIIQDLLFSTKKDHAFIQKLLIDLAVEYELENPALEETIWAQRRNETIINNIILVKELIKELNIFYIEIDNKLKEEKYEPEIYDRRPETTMAKKFLHPLDNIVLQLDEITDFSAATKKTFSDAMTSEDATLESKNSTFKFTKESIVKPDITSLLSTEIQKQKKAAEEKIQKSKEQLLSDAKKILDGYIFLTNNCNLHVEDHQAPQQNDCIILILDRIETYKAEIEMYMDSLKSSDSKKESINAIQSYTTELEKITKKEAAISSFCIELATLFLQANTVLYNMALKKDQNREETKKAIYALYKHIELSIQQHTFDSYELLLADVTKKFISIITPYKKYLPQNDIIILFPEFRDEQKPIAENPIKEKKPDVDINYFDYDLVGDFLSYTDECLESLEKEIQIQNATRVDCKTLNIFEFQDGILQCRDTVLSAVTTNQRITSVTIESFQALFSIDQKNNSTVFINLFCRNLSNRIEKIINSNLDIAQIDQSSEEINQKVSQINEIRERLNKIKSSLQSKPDHSFNFIRCHNEIITLEKKLVDIQIEISDFIAAQRQAEQERKEDELKHTDEPKEEKNEHIPLEISDSIATKRQADHADKPKEEKNKHTPCSNHSSRLFAPPPPNAIIGNDNSTLFEHLSKLVLRIISQGTQDKEPGTLATTTSLSQNPFRDTELLILKLRVKIMRDEIPNDKAFVQLYESLAFAVRINHPNYTATHRNYNLYITSKEKTNELLSTFKQRYDELKANIDRHRKPSQV